MRIAFRSIPSLELDPQPEDEGPPPDPDLDKATGSKPRHDRRPA